MSEDPRCVAMLMPARGPHGNVPIHACGKPAVGADRRDRPLCARHLRVVLNKGELVKSLPGRSLPLRIFSE